MQLLLTLGIPVEYQSRGYWIPLSAGNSKRYRDNKGVINAWFLAHDWRIRKI